MALFTGIGVALGASATVAAGATMSAAMATGIGVSAMAAGAVGYSMYSNDQQMKAAKRAADARNQAQMPTTPQAPAQVDAAKIAQEKVADKRRAAARVTSVQTNPLGVRDEAQVVRKKLLGA